MMHNLRANYELQYTLLQQIINYQNDYRILFLKGSSGTGKTYLLEQASREQRILNTRLVLIDLNPKLSGTVNTLKDVIAHFQDSLFGQNEAILHRIEEKMSQMLLFSPSQVYPWSSQNDKGDPFENTKLAVRITKILIDLLSSMQSQVVLVIDHYESSNREIREWINLLLIEVARSESMRVVISGRKTPHISIQWSRYAQTCELNGIPHPEPWLPVYKTLIPEFDSNPVSVMHTLCKYCNGNPRAIMEFLWQTHIEQNRDYSSHTQINDKSNDRTETTVFEGIIPISQNQGKYMEQLHEWLVTLFSEDELKGLCFYKLNVEYDDLPGSGKASKAHGLVMYHMHRQILDKLENAIKQERLINFK